MIQTAKETLEKLGLMDSIYRRHAHIQEIPIQEMLYVDRENSKPLSVFDKLREEIPLTAQKIEKLNSISLQEFLNVALNGANSLQILVTSQSKFVSLIAPVHTDANPILKWGNGFSWTYSNNCTDNVISTKVKNAGGNINGELRVSLEWFHRSDYDLHVTQPNKHKIYFRNKRDFNTSGYLDVDMNVGEDASETPVENVIFTEKQKMLEGEYVVEVNNFAKRHGKNPNMNIQIECQGVVYNYNYPQQIADGDTVEICRFTYTKSSGVTNIRSKYKGNEVSQDICGCTTGKFSKVVAAFYSPNYWTNAKDDKGIGNKHLFFIFDKARIDEPLCPFFNEFLTPAIYEHRKTFEVLASSLMVEPTEEQVTGLGFSLTQQDSFVAKIDDKIVKVIIGNN